MNKHHSVIVLGGGPAGTATAYTLSKQGIDVCLIDKAVFPRDKLCAGLLTIRSKKIFERIFSADWENAYEYRSNTVKFFYKNIFLNSVENYSEVFLTCRYHFDNYLLSLILEKNVPLYLGKTVKSIDLKNKICSLRSGEQLSYDYLVGADGVNSIVAKTIFGRAFDKKTIGFALEMEVDRDTIKQEMAVPEIYMGHSRWGYAWVFPKQRTVTVGIVGIQSKNPDLKASFIEFVNNTFGEIPTGKLKGHHIPFGDYRKKLGDKQALLTGDAAGFVDPITGEGIAYAMQSGQLAALAIAESIRSGQNVVEIYTEKCTEITRSFAYAKLLSHSFYHPLGQKLYSRMLPRRNDLALRHMDVLAGEMEYKQGFRYLLAEMGELMVSKFRRQ